MRWFSCFKAYGDLVIASNVIRRADLSQNGILIGSHLRPLLDTLNFPGQSKVVEVGDVVPALFDIKKCGYLRAMICGFWLKRGIRRILDPRYDTLVFDQLGIRQQFIASQFHIESLGVEDNIYKNYAEFLGISLSITPTISSSKSKRTKVYVFPDSRLREKELPYSLLRDIVEVNKRYGKSTTIVKVGLPTELPPFVGAEIKWLNGFPQLLSVIRGADAVVSADSLPAHLAEYNQIPVYVFTPVPNDYWMPLSSYADHYFSLFNVDEQYKTWIKVL
ncbi:hypothetical protein [Geotalea sp. SG265]|uniref:hypothetical protein n=1 Tax=Geotalea sp. SG265 TaxID=2922867 RepID=UPI001FB02BE9|nr:hypothetical protein [Geotalea sp. SG265]